MRNYDLLIDKLKKNGYRCFIEIDFEKEINKMSLMVPSDATSLYIVKVQLLTFEFETIVDMEKFKNIPLYREFILDIERIIGEVINKTPEGTEISSDYRIPSISYILSKEEKCRTYYEQLVLMLHNNDIGKERLDNEKAKKLFLSMNQVNKAWFVQCIDKEFINYLDEVEQQIIFNWSYLEPKPVLRSYI